MIVYTWNKSISVPGKIGKLKSSQFEEKFIWIAWIVSDEEWCVYVL